MIGVVVLVAPWAAIGALFLVLVIRQWFRARAVLAILMRDRALMPRRWESNRTRRRRLMQSYRYR